MTCYNRYPTLSKFPFLNLQKPVSFHVLPCSLPCSHHSSHLTLLSVSLRCSNPNSLNVPISPSHSPHSPFKTTPFVTKSSINSFHFFKLPPRASSYARFQLFTTMSGATKLHSATKQVHEPPRAILCPTGNRARVLEEGRRKIEVLQKSQQKPKKPVEKMSQAAVKNNLSVDSTCSSDSSSSTSGVSSSSRKNVKHYGTKKVKDVRNGGEIKDVSSKKEGPVKRCDWITPNSDPLYMSFHDEEWGVPVYDDRKLFELLVYSQALAELSWPAILHMRDIFRKLFDSFDPSSIAQFTEKKLLSLKFNGNLLLSEPKLRAVVENAKQMLKIQQEFGSFSNYCWRFVNQKPLRNGFRYARQVPVKTPKAELMSKDLMQRGFRCVGPTAVYSFMQVAGFVNDHLQACFRYQECNAEVKKNFKPRSEETEIVTEASGNTCVSHD